jgi:hypothetical protein
MGLKRWNLPAAVSGSGGTEAHDQSGSIFESTEVHSEIFTGRQIGMSDINFYPQKIEGGQLDQDVSLDVISRRRAFGRLEGGFLMVEAVIDTQLDSGVKGLQIDHVFRTQKERKEGQPGVLLGYGRLPFFGKSFESRRYSEQMAPSSLEKRMNGQGEHSFSLPVDFFITGIGDRVPSGAEFHKEGVRKGSGTAPGRIFGRKIMIRQTLLRPA